MFVKMDPLTSRTGKKKILAFLTVSILLAINGLVKMYKHWKVCKELHDSIIVSSFMLAEG